MSSLTPTVSPLRQRMIDDMRMRKFTGKTKLHYIRAVRRPAAYLKRSPATATADELRAFQLHMVDTGTAPPTINSTLSGLKFFFDVTLSHGEAVVKMQPVPQPRPLPVVLSGEEVARLIAAAPNAKYLAALSGLRRRAARQRGRSAEGHRCPPSAWRYWPGSSAGAASCRVMRSSHPAAGCGRRIEPSGIASRQILEQRETMMATASRIGRSATRTKAAKSGTPRTASKNTSSAGVTTRAGARTEYRIYPSIGIARIGDSGQAFFIGPESPGSLPEGPYRDADGIRPQAARFRIYRIEIDANENEKATAEILPSATTKIEWSVQLANRKAAAMKIEDTLARVQNPKPRNKGFNRPKLVISAQASIKGTNAAAVPMSGRIEFSRGSAKGKVVDNIDLAKLTTGADGRLLVVGGKGKSGSPLNAKIDSFSDNDGWYDSVSDGPVQATLSIKGETLAVVPAWVVITVPRYAPQIYGIVTWYDQAVSMARTADDGSFDPPRSTSFTKDIFPILARADGLHVVHQGTHAGGPRPLSDDARLHELQSQPSRVRLLAKLTPLNLQAPQPEDKPVAGDGSGFRMPYMNSGANPDPAGSPWAYLSLTRYQLAHVQNWVAGNFTADWPGKAPVPVPFDQIAVGDQPAALNQAALEACVGGSFFPGIEGTYDIARVATYHPQRNLRRDLRLNPAHLPGFVTEKMALPWQADFADCADYWWPSQRPVNVRKQDETQAEWARGITGTSRNAHLNMVEFWSSLAHVLRVPGGTDFVETGRKPINGVS
jgi:L-Lysine epsilon oxidase N-terminal/L-lysine epsilon oxidase C-terminal domain/Phage integrase, N-terminal SAM-like domain